MRWKSFGANKAGPASQWFQKNLLCKTKDEKGRDRDWDKRKFQECLILKWEIKIEKASEINLVTVDESGHTNKGWQELTSSCDKIPRI